MTNRERYFATVRHHKADRVLFCPDVTDWYLGNQRVPGEPLKYGPGCYIGDDEELKNYHGSLPERFQGKGLMQIYREHGWGFHAHIYDWYDEEYADGVSKTVKTDKNFRQVCYTTPSGQLSRLYQLAFDGSWCPIEFLVKSKYDFPQLFEIIRAQRYCLREDAVKFVLDGIGEDGQADLAVARSPFGKLVHEYLGFEQTVYFMYDNDAYFDEYMRLQEQKDMELLALAAQSRAKLVILSDHADETLISPDWYRQYCMPFYRRACDLLHQSGKIVSTHLDGNIKGLLPLLPHCGFDVLDGCTPAPMFNYQPEELAEALPDTMSAFVGVPSALFCDNTPQKEILAYADRLLRAFDGNLILNVGDILPCNGNIDHVEAIGWHLDALYSET